MGLAAGAHASPLSTVRRANYIPGLAAVSRAVHSLVPPPMPSLPNSLFSPVVGNGATVAQAAGAEGPPEGIRTLVQTLPIALVLLAAYVLLFRPEREKARRQQELLAGLKKNDRVVTAAGMYGTVANVDRDGDRVTLRIDDTARVTVTLSSIARIVGDRGGDAEAKGTTRDDE